MINVGSLKRTNIKIVRMAAASFQHNKIAQKKTKYITSSMTLVKMREKFWWPS